MWSVDCKFECRCQICQLCQICQMCQMCQVSTLATRGLPTSWPFRLRQDLGRSRLTKLSSAMQCLAVQSTHWQRAPGDIVHRRCGWKAQAKQRIYWTLELILILLDNLGNEILQQFSEFTQIRKFHRDRSSGSTHLCIAVASAQRTVATCCDSSLHWLRAFFIARAGFSYEFVCNNGNFLIVPCCLNLGCWNCWILLNDLLNRLQLRWFFMAFRTTSSGIAFFKTSMTCQPSTDRRTSADRECQVLLHGLVGWCFHIDRMLCWVPRSSKDPLLFFPSKIPLPQLDVGFSIENPNLKKMANSWPNPHGLRNLQHIQNNIAWKSLNRLSQASYLPIFTKAGAFLCHRPAPSGILGCHRQTGNVASPGHPLLCFEATPTRSSSDCHTSRCDEITSIPLSYHGLKLSI